VSDFGALVVQLRLGGGDTSGVEVKSAAGGLPTAITHSLSALANLPGGGLIILGLDERAEFTPVGLTNVQGLKQGLAGKARALTPPAHLDISDQTVDGHAVVVARVAECPAPDKPCRVTSTRKAYLRGHDGDYLLSELEEQGFLRSREAPSADRQVVPGTGIADLDPALVGAWTEQVRARRPALAAFSGDDLLHKAGILAATGELTRAGLLALGTYPQEYLPQLVVRAANLRDPDPRVRASNITTLDGPIPTLLTAAMAWLRTNLPTAVVESSDGSVRNVPRFPLEALRELVANALVHRDLSPWSEGMAVELRLEEHTLVLTNPGGLYGITVDRLGSDHVTSARNGRLVALCENVADPSDGSRAIEALASGLPRVTRSLEDAALPPARYFDVGLRFTVILSTGPKEAGSSGDAPAGGEAAAVAGVRGLKSGSQLARVYQSLVDCGGQTVTEIAEATGIAGPSIRRALTRLREDYGYVESDGGPGRRTTYSVLLEPPAPGARRV